MQDVDILIGNLGANGPPAQKHVEQENNQGEDIVVTKLLQIVSVKHIKNANVIGFLVTVKQRLCVFGIKFVD